MPIGNLTSQFWANVYLNSFDHFVKRELHCSAYLRYVDDFLLFNNDKSILWKWKNALIKRLARYRLVIHTGTHPRPVEEGIPFLGFIVTPQKRRIKKRKGIYFQRKYSNMITEYQSGQIPLKKITLSVQGWVNHVRYGNTIGLRKAILMNPFECKSVRK